MKSVTTELNEIVSRQNVITDSGLLKEYLRTGLSPSNLDGSELVAPIAAVRPVSTKHVSDILQFATKESVPVFIYGGGTSLAGGILGNEPGIIIDMRSMNNIISVSLEDRVARVQAGVLLPQLNSVLQAGNVFMAHDPQAFETTTIGGAVATNGTGYLTSKYGSMGDQVIGMEVVLPTGDILGSSQIAQTYSPGLNVGNIFIGTEGIYGVITEVLIRLFPEPQERRHYALEFESFQHGFLAIQWLFSEGIIPAMIMYFFVLGTFVQVFGCFGKPWKTQWFWGCLGDVDRTKCNGFDVEFVGFCCCGGWVGGDGERQPKKERSIRRNGVCLKSPFETKVKQNWCFGYFGSCFVKTL